MEAIAVVPRGWGHFFMQGFRNAGIALAVTLAMPFAAQASIPPATPADQRPELFELNNQIVVKHWVLCIARSYAVQVVQARQSGADEARKTIAELQATRFCAEFPEMTVILHEPVVAQSPFVTHAARAFSAEISIGGQWISAYVVNARLRG